MILAHDGSCRWETGIANTIGRRGGRERLALWAYAARTPLAAAAVAVLLALVKYARAFGDPPLDGVGDAASGVVAELGQSDLAGDGASEEMEQALDRDATLVV
jgi:hypothetical protein